MLAWAASYAAATFPKASVKQWRLIAQPSLMPRGNTMTKEELKQTLDDMSDVDFDVMTENQRRKVLRQRIQEAFDLGFAYAHQKAK